MIHLLDASTGKKVFQTGDLASWVYLTAPVLSADGRVIAYVSTNEDTLHWKNLANGQEGQVKVTSYGKFLALSPDGKGLITWGPAGMLRVRSLVTGLAIRSVDTAKKATAIELSRDGRTVALAAGQVVELHRIAD